MREALFLTIGFIVGSLGGIVLMCLLQINHIGKEPEHEQTKY